MRSSVQFRFLTGALLIIFSGLFIIGCAAKKSEPWGNEKTGFILTYRPEIGTTLKYDYTLDGSQIMDVMGNEMEGTTGMKAEVFVTAKSKSSEGDLTFGMQFNSCAIDASGPQGDMSPDMSDYIGNELIMKISDKGKMIEMENKEQFLPYEGSFLPVYFFFQNIFYNLAEEPVKINESWTSTDSQTDTFGENELKGDITSTFTVIEKVMKDNIECLKIGLEYTGDIEGSGFQMGAEFTSEGELKAQGELFFAYKEGYFIEINYTETSEITISIQGMDIPIKGTSKYSIKLLQ